MIIIYVRKYEYKSYVYILSKIKEHVFVLSEIKLTAISK